MARLRDTSGEEEEDDTRAVSRDAQPASTPAPGYSENHSFGASPSPSPSTSSDKENQNRNDQTKSKTTMAPPPRPVASRSGSSSNVAKRRRIGDHTGPLRDQGARSRSATEEPENEFYDPNQDLEERRKVVKSLRDLNKDASDMRSAWLAPDSTGLRDAVDRANSLFEHVKQTSDATIDSRLLVTAGDLTYKKTQQASTGTGSQGVDVEDFVSKCVSFMRAGDEGEDGATGRQRPGRQTGADVDSDAEQENTQNEGDAMNWAWLGSQACFPANSRPPLSGFLLGPLSLQKRARTQTQRRARQARLNPDDAIRPQELEARDIQQQEQNNLTSVCKKIYEGLANIISIGQQKVQDEVDANDDISDEEVNKIFDKHNLCKNVGVPLFRFAVNPRSFGQTVENLFYVSFLIKEGLVGVGEDDESGMPTLHYVDLPGGDQQEQETEKRRRQNAPRNQAVFSLDFDTWKELIEMFKIRESLIPHRVEGEAQTVSATGWYG